jgi:prepilin-type processing-associated H-X9-DG protein
MEVMNTGQSIQVVSEEAIPLSPQTIQRRHYLVLAHKHGYRPPQVPAPVFHRTITTCLPPGFKKASGHSCRRLLFAMGLGVALVALGICVYGAVLSTHDKRVRIQQVNCLKQIGLAFRVYATDHPNQFPASRDQLKAAGLLKDRELIDPVSGQPFSFVAGVTENEPQAILAYGASNRHGRRNVVMGDGSVLTIDSHRFAQALEAHRKVEASVTRPNR